MNPPDLERKIVEAARWMFGRENSKDFVWTPGVLTRENPDATSPGYSTSDAENVFEELRKRDLLENKVVITENKIPIIVYKINEERKREWTDLVSKKGSYALFFVPWASYLFGKSFPALKGLGYAIILAFLAKFAQNFADYLWVPPTQVEILQGKQSPQE